MLNLRFIVAVLLVCTALVLSVGGSVLAKKAGNELLQISQQIENAQNEKEAESYVNSLNECWEKNENLLTLLLNRQETEQLGAIIARIDSVQKYEELKTVAQNAGELSSMLRDMLSEEKFSIYNLF